jgi:hypothetical protein
MASVKAGVNTLWAGTVSPALPAVRNWRTGAAVRALMCGGVSGRSRALNTVPEKQESNRKMACLASTRRAQASTSVMDTALLRKPRSSTRGSGASAGTR